MLRNDLEGTLDTAVEEVIRWASPVNYMTRTATHDVKLHDQLIRGGDKVALMYSSASPPILVTDLLARRENLSPESSSSASSHAITSFTPLGRWVPC